MKEAIILCGGQGKRLRPLTFNIPKALVKYQHKTLLDWQIDQLEKFGYDRVVLVAGYLGFKLLGWARDNQRKIKVSIIVENEPLGTAGALKLGLKEISSENVTVMNVDDLNDVDLDMLELNGTNSLVVTNPVLQFGVIEEEQGIIKKFVEKPKLIDKLVSMGIYYLNKNDFSDLPEKGSLETDVFPNKNLKAFMHAGYWKTINTMKDLDD